MTAWKNLHVTPDVPPSIDPISLLLESRFPGTLSRDDSKETSKSLFHDRFTAILELGDITLRQMKPNSASVDRDRMIILGLAATVGDEDTVKELFDRADTHSEWELHTLEQRLALLQGTDEPGDVDNPFKQLIWRRGANRFVFLMRSICAGTFSPLTALMGHREELQTRRLILQLLGNLIHADETEHMRARFAAHMQTLERASGIKIDTPTAALDDSLLETLSVRISDAGDRFLLLAEVYFIATLNGTLTEQEIGLVERVASALQISPERRLELQSAVLRRFEENADLRQGFSLSGLLDRTRRSTTDVVEKILKKNAAAIGNEIRETGDLMQLLVKSANEELTLDEQARMKEQLHDLCRAVPCLALFAAPGGSLLIPVLQRLLPINILPSSFTDESPASGQTESVTRDDLEAAKIV